MKKPGATTYRILCVSFGIVFLMGCDLLGLGPKKQNDSNKQPETMASPVPVSQNTQEPSPPGPLPSNVLVRIGKWTLTEDEFNGHINLLKQQYSDFKDDDANAKSAVLEGLIRQQLLVKEAEDSDVADSKEFKEAMEDYRNTLLVQEMANRLTKEVIATDDDARAYYDANKDKFTEPVKWNVREIVVGDEATAKNVVIELYQGGNFAQIARAQSKAADASSGGKLKPFITGKAPFEAMQIAIANLDAGGISGVFKGPEGYYIVKVESKSGGTVKPFNDLKKDLVYYLTQQKQQNVILNHLKELAEKDKPEYNKELIDQIIGKATQ